MPTVEKRVRELREARGWTQVQLGVYAGISPSTVNLIEHGHRNPNTTTLQKLATALGVEPGDLFTESDSPKVSAPPSLQPSFNDVLSEDERREEEAEGDLEGDLFLLGGAVGAERPSLEEFSEDLLVRTLGRLIAVRRRLRDSESEELRRVLADLTDRLIIPVAQELDERLIGGLGEEKLVERLSERDYAALAELYRLSEPRKESMPRMHAVAERSLARSGARVGVRGEWEEEPLSAMQRERSAAPRTPDEASGAEAG
jgi:transcriptional regulator with XRE-family HTH domain